MIHKVVIVLESEDNNPSVDMSIKFEPTLQGADIEELGYYPAVYAFLDKHIMPMLSEVAEERTVH